MDLLNLNPKLIYYQFSHFVLGINTSLQRIIISFFLKLLLVILLIKIRFLSQSGLIQNTYNLMNINFIRNLSDQILRENQQLKTQVIILKQKISDYEDEMVNAFTSLNNNLKFMNDPYQLLKDFIKWTKELYYENRQLQQQLAAEKQSIKSLHLQIKMLEQQNICKDSQLQIERQKQSRLSEQNRSVVQACQLQKKKLIQDCDQLSKQLVQLKEQMRLQKMMLVETKRKEIEQMRQYHLKQFLQFREKADREVVSVQKHMQDQLIEKDKMIKSLQTAIEKVSKNLKLEDSQSSTLINLLKSFQQYNHLSNIIQERSQEIYKFRQQLQEQEYVRIKLQSKLKQIGMNEMNLISQLQRANMQKRDLENKLQAKTLILSKSEKDKEAMEQYYDSKWNQEYKKVKMQLERSFGEKLKNMEEECVKKQEILTKKVEESEKQRKAIQTSNIQLQQKIDQSAQKLEESLRRISQLQKEITQLGMQKFQLELMANQEIIQAKNTHNHSKHQYQEQIQKLNSQLSLQKSSVDDIQNKHKQEIQQCQRVSKIQLQKVVSQKESEKKMMEHNFKQQMSKLQQQIKVKQLYIEDVKAKVRDEIQKEINEKWEQAQQHAQVKIRQKQQEMSKKNDKWMIKYKQVDIKFTQLKKKNEEEQQNFKKEIAKYDLQNQILKNGESKYHAQMKQFMTVKSQLLMKQSELQRKITQNNLQIKNKSEQICSLQEIIVHKEKQINNFKNQRLHWLSQITDVQKAFKQQFDQLKKIHDKQINCLKSKIWQLEEMMKKRPIKRKDFQMIQQLDKQRKMLRNQVYIKEAENIILNQVKDYYESKLKQTQKNSVEEDNNIKIGSALMGYKLKMLKKKDLPKHAFTEAHQSKDMVQMKKYIVKSAKKTQKSINKVSLEETDRYHRFHTTHE